MANKGKKYGKATKPQGFAAMDKEYHRSIASKGGKKSHQLGTAHRWNSDEARQVALKELQTRQQKAKERHGKA